MTWTEALTEGRHWDEGRDRARVRKAFQTLCRTRTSWPAPADLLTALPPVERLLALPTKPCDPDVARRYVEEINREIKGWVANG